MKTIKKLSRGIVGIILAFSIIFSFSACKDKKSAESGTQKLDAIEKIMNTLGGCHTICGSSNISFGLPVRKLLNRTFVSMAIAKGLDAVIINPLDTSMTSAVTASLALAEQDDFCMEYIKAYRADRLS